MPGHSVAVELRGFGPLPSLGQMWKLRDQGIYGTAPQGWAWAVFTNSQSGDLMSFAVENCGTRSAPKVSLSGPWLSTASEAFPNGNPMWVGNPGQGLRGNWIRHNLIELTVGDSRLKKNISHDAIEYSIVFEDDVPRTETGTNRLAHGYGLALGNLRVLVQHTSTRAITSEDAQSMVAQLLALHVERESLPSKREGE
jgi:hypothetical protein